MKMNEYQEKAMTTCMPTSENFAYMTMNLIGEVGEFMEKAMGHVNPVGIRDMMEVIVLHGEEASKIAKAIRKGEYGHCGEELQLSAMTEEETLALQKECGDIMWQLYGLMSVLGWDAEQIAKQNLEKLASRKNRNKIDGDGDER